MRKILAAIVLLLFSTTAFCQEQQQLPVYLGPIGSYSFGSPVSINRAVSATQIFTTGGKGISWDNSVGAGARLMMPTLFSNHFGLAATAAYAKGSGTFKSIDFTYEGHPVVFKIISNYQTAELSALATYSLSSKWFISAGLYSSVRAGSDLLQRIEITDGSHFDDRSTDDTVASGEQLATSRIHYGAEIGIGGRFPISNLLSITCGSFTRFDLGEIARGFAPTAISGGVNLGVLFDLNPPVIPTEKITEEPILRASVFFTVGGISTRVASSTRSDTLRERYVALAPVVQFTGSTISPMYQLLTKAQAEGFDPTSFDRQSPEICYSNVLNIIGKRLQDLPQETIGLSSSSVPNAQVVKEYFITVWGINASRIEIKNGNSGDVRLSGSAKLLSPQINSWLDEYRRTPEITIDKLITSSRGVKEWTLTISDGATTIATYSNSATGQHNERSSLAERSIDTTEHLFRAQLKAVDSDGMISRASDSIRIVPTHTNTNSSAQTKSYILLADDLTAEFSWSSHLLSTIAALITEKQTVVIHGLYSGSKTSAATVSATLLKALQTRQFKAKQIIIKEEPQSRSVPEPISSSVEITISES